MKLKLATIFLLLLSFIQSYSQSNQKYIGKKQLYYGAAYYPEVWNMDLKAIDNDIKRMKELNMNVMRIAEFSWAKMEPKEGVYDFKWLHLIVDKLYENGIDVIMCTPTATPPIWMATKYPQIFIKNEDNTVQTHGGRRNCSYTSDIYITKSIQISEKMSMEFGKKPGVIGWQTDNEFNLISDYSLETKSLWTKWLKERYKSIDSLNYKWSANLWSQHYDSFDEVPMYRTNVWHHTSLQFNWYQFSNDMLNDYQNYQINAIRKYSNLPITHDGMPGQRVDYPKIFKNLDYMSVNNYHSFEAYDLIQSNYDRMRGYQKGYYWLFETAPNYSGGNKTWFLHQPNGSMRAALWMNYAMGGQGSMFWLWKQQPAGQEMVHGSIISAWDKPAANYQDLKNLGAELKKTSSFLMENPVADAKIAIVYSHEANNGFVCEEYANDIKYYNDWTYRFYLPMAENYLHQDVIHPGVDINKYKLIFLPILPNIPVEFQNKLKKWVADGGILIAGPMTSYRNENLASYTNYALGDFEKWMGIGVNSRIPIGTKLREKEIKTKLIFDTKLVAIKDTPQAFLWSESLYSSKGKIVAKYTGEGMHENLSAIFENQIGKGKVVFLGTDPGKNAVKEIIKTYAKQVGVEPFATGDNGVVVIPRKGKKEGLIIVNISTEEKKLKLNSASYKDLLNDSKNIDSENIILKPYEVNILSK